MELISLLSATNPEIWIYGTTYNIYLDFIGNLIKNLILGVGSVGVGIILFSVILRVIVLPFDVYQRIAMRKQNNKMKENQAKMEKLQKQYANNKDLYNQKVMEMYKESGVSPCSSCLPMILSMVIFFVAIGAFNAFSQYANVKNYNDMVQAYNGALVERCATISPDADDALVYTVEGDMIRIVDENKVIYYEVSKSGDLADFNPENIKETDYTNISIAQKYYYIDCTKALADTDIHALVEADTSEKTESEKIQNAVIALAQNAVVDTYHDTVYVNSSFLWIKNVWETDAAYKTPIVDYTSFEQNAKQQKFDVGGTKVEYANIGKYVGGDGNPYSAEAYNHITGALTAQKSEANGYFILIALSIGTILLQQIVSMRSQKEQQKYSSVDGQAGTQQKTMLVVMTIMFAIFSFMYSSAFSIYMIMSNVLSLLSTLLINKIVDVVEGKKEQQAFLKKYDQKRVKTDDAKSGKKGK